MENLKDMFAKNEPGIEVEANMMLTYATQRQTINSKDHDLSVTVSNWPYLFKEKCLLQHCNHLLDIDIIEKMQKGSQSKVPKLMKYLKVIPKVTETVNKFEKAVKRRKRTLHRSSEF